MDIHVETSEGTTFEWPDAVLRALSGENPWLSVVLIALALVVTTIALRRAQREWPQRVTPVARLSAPAVRRPQ